MMDNKVLLMILDGWGIAKNAEVSAIDHANTPFMDSLYGKHPHAKLEASGLAVGLPDGQMGNSEVGHMNIGAGRVVYQDLVKINNAVADGTLGENEVLNRAYTKAAERNQDVHLIGLVSDGGVHSHIKHVKGLVSAAADKGIENLYVHAFTDGRDCDPKSGKGFMHELEEHMDATTGQLATIVGRYYAMDRDNRWERVSLAYNALVNSEGEFFSNSQSAIQASYDKGVTDEFIKPIILIDKDDKPRAKIKDGDLVICFNFRTDRGREITQALTQQDFPEYGMKKLDLDYLTMTNYDDSFKGISVIYGKDDLTNTLGEVLEKAGKKQIRIAETEKYPHVTFFFSGGREKPFDGEKRILCPSPKVATYDLQPEMSAKEIAESIIPELNSREPDFICLNFANPDMVGHTGDFDAAVKACETVDYYTSKVVAAAEENGYTVIIIADHGNPDIMVNEDGSPNTAHTTNLVPFIVISDNYKNAVKDGKLGDLAPTILTLMGVDIPEDMTGDVLLS